MPDGSSLDHGIQINRPDPVSVPQTPKTERSYRVLLWTLALVGLAADQASKYGVFNWLQPVKQDVAVGGIDDDFLQHRSFAVFQAEPESRSFSVLSTSDHTRRGFFLAPDYKTDGLGEYVRSDSWRYASSGGFEPHVNHGALFGFMQDKKKTANTTFAVISLLAACAIVYWSRQKNTAKDRWLCVSLGLILAGTLGNFYDRLVFNGVRDFLHWNYAFDWPVFNVADCCLVVGACLLLLQAFFAPASQPSPQESKRAELVGPATTQG